jgi:alkylation response protein AidB-like acyl-CoA dehydrogenase
MNFQLTAELAELRAKVRAFVDDEIIPNEAELISDPQRVKLKALQAQVKTKGLWTPHLPKALGGLGLGPMGMATLFREMGRSPIGAKIFHCDAPDQGNMDLLLAQATPEQQKRWLEPLVRAEITSAFCMTEPAPGAGADPTNLKTAAKETAAGWEINGQKWFSTGARNASVLIVMARTSDDLKTGASMFIVDRNAKGVRYDRDIPVMSPDVLDHIEGQLTFEGVVVPKDAVLGGVGQGFALAQARLVPARLTHCMRWLGLQDVPRHAGFLRQGAGAAPGGADQDRRERERDSRGQPDDVSLRMAARAGPDERGEAVFVDGEEPRGAAALPGARRRDPAAWRARLLARPAVLDVVPGRARGAHRRRARRGAPDRDRARLHAGALRAARMSLRGALLWLALAGKPVETPAGTPLVLELGETRKIAVACDVKRLRAVNGPYRARMVGTDLVELVAFAEGSSTLTVWCTDDRRLDYPVTIKKR